MAVVSSQEGKEPTHVKTSLRGLLSLRAERKHRGRENGA